MATPRTTLGYGIALLAMLLTGATELAAQSAGNSIFNGTVQREDWFYANPQITDSTMELVVTALMNVQADSYVAIFGVEQEGETMMKAQELIDERLGKFIEGMKKLGIPESDMYVDFVSHIPMYSFEVEQKLYSHSYIEVPVGFSIRKNIHVQYKQWQMLDKIIPLGIAQEMYDIVKVDYVINNTKKVYDSLRHVSVAMMADKQRDFEKLGIKFTTFYQTLKETSLATFPIERYMGYKAFGGVKVSSSSVNKGATYFGRSETRSAEKPQTLYYNKLPEKSFDIIINPGGVQPMVQYSYQLSVRYALRNS